MKEDRLPVSEHVATSAKPPTVFKVMTDGIVASGEEMMRMP